MLTLWMYALALVTVIAGLSIGLIMAVHMIPLVRIAFELFVWSFIICISVNSIYKIARLVIKKFRHRS